MFRSISRSVFYKLIAVLITSLLFACSESSGSKISYDPITFEKADECHVCGMAITRFAGPKGQAFETRSDKVRKFCSTLDLVVWYLQPENKPNIKAIYVHDMGRSPWESPNDEHLISARDAVFVIGSDMQGSMGKTLASFLKETDAAKFAEQHGGELVVFNGLSLELLNKYR